MPNREELLKKCESLKQHIETFSKTQNNIYKTIQIQTLRAELLKTARLLEELDRKEGKS